MAYYQALKGYRDQPDDPAFPIYGNKKGRIAGRLLALRAALDKEILAERKPNSLIIGSWNIRAFDDGRPRMDESYHYIAEIIDHFDICAVQEVKSDLKPLRRLLRMLGPQWDYFVSDVTAGGPGNKERMAFLYNRNRVIFRNQIGEISLPKDKLIDGAQIARSPFFASFQAAWFRFSLCSVHILFAGTSKADKAQRAKEVSAIAKVLADRAKREDEVYVLLGDMNIVAEGDAIMQALTKEGLHVPLFGATNLSGTKHFDQIAFTHQAIKTKFLNKGCFDWRGTVFTKDEADHYKPHAEAAKGEPYADWARSYKNWTTYEMSDHLPIWIEIEVDYSDEYLARIVGD